MTVATYHARRGRLGPATRRALAELLPRYGVAADGGVLGLATMFGAHTPVVLEIGCGRGEATIRMAQDQPDTAIIAVDVHPPGVAALLTARHQGDAPNVTPVLGDAVVLLQRRIPPDSLQEIRAFFPDPWPKTRHRKRRLFRPELVSLMARRMAPGGILHTATDDPDYAAHMLAVLQREPLLANCGAGYTARPTTRPVTAYESRGLAAGRPIRDLVFRRLDDR